MTTVLFAVVLITAAGTRCVEKPVLETAKFSGDDSLVKSFLLICEGPVFSFTFMAAGEAGMRNIDISSLDTIIASRDCEGARQCMLTGVFPLGKLPSEIVTVSASDTRGRIQKEKIRLAPSKNTAKVYMIGSLPGLDEAIMSMPPVQYSDQPANPPKPIQKNELAINPDKAPEGPAITLKIDRKSPDSYIITGAASDPAGIDFVELLENGRFLDVIKCEGKPDCFISAEISGRKSGKYAYKVKSFSTRGGFSFKEENVTVE